MPTKPRRPTGLETRAAVKEAALRVFRAHGYSAAGLEEVGREIGVTRSAVLFHFGSKAELLREIVEPFEVHIDAVLAIDLADAPLSPARRRQLIADMVDCYARHRDVFRLIAQDVTCHEPLDIDARIAARRLRFYHLVGGPDLSGRDMTLLDATLGAITIPMFSPNFDLDEDGRETLIDAAASIARKVGRPAKPAALASPR